VEKGVRGGKIREKRKLRAARMYWGRELVGRRLSFLGIEVLEESVTSGEFPR